MRRCVGVQYLNECDYVCNCGDGYGCQFDEECDFQRPKIISHNCCHRYDAEERYEKEKQRADDYKMALEEIEGHRGACNSCMSMIDIAAEVLRKYNTEEE